MSRSTSPEPINVTLSDGTVAKGTYIRIGNMVTVRTTHDSRTAPVGNTPIEIMARLILHEMASGEKG